MYSKKVEKALSLGKVNTLRTAIATTAAKGFASSLELSNLLLKGSEWVATADGKAFLIEQKWGVDLFFFNIYGYQKSFSYKLIKMAKAVEADPMLLVDFNEQCDAIIDNDGKVSRSVANFIQFIADSKLEQPAANATESEEGDGEEGESSEGEGTAGKAQVQGKKKAIFTLAFNGEGVGLQNAAVRIDADGVLKTSSTAIDIEVALDYLRQALEGAKAAEAAAAEKKSASMAKAAAAADAKEAAKAAREANVAAKAAEAKAAAEVAAPAKPKAKTSPKAAPAKPKAKAAPLSTHLTEVAEFFAEAAEVAEFDAAI